MNRSLPAISRIVNFPNQLLMKIPVKMNVAHLKINDLDIAYEEYNPDSKQSGIVYLDNVKLDALNISNFNNNRKPFTVNGSALFMHQVPVQASFSFNMSNSKGGRFTANFGTSEFDGKIINSFAEPLGLVKLENGSLQ